jgi:hypothetical protein
VRADPVGQTLRPAGFGARRARCARHRSLFARLWCDAFSRSGDASFRRAGRARRRRDRADGRDRHQARRVRRPQLRWPRGLCRGDAVAAPMRRPGDGEQLPDPGSGPRHGPGQSGIRSGTNTISRSSAAAPGSTPTGARSRGFYRKSGRRTGISMTPPSIARRPRTTILMTSMS